MNHQGIMTVASDRTYDGMDPLAEKYYQISTYAYVANNPIIFIDPDGRQIVGVTRRDARIFHQDLNTIFGNEQFDQFRSLITRSGRTFDKVDASALESALEGLDGDNLALAQMVAGAINSDDIHMVEFVGGDFVSDEGAQALIAEEPIYAEALRDGKLGNWVVENRKGGLNVRTESGSHSFIRTNKRGDSRAVLSGHEVFGHGIPSAKGIQGKANNVNAIRAENLIRRVLGIEQRDGRGHTGSDPYPNPYKLPIIK